MSAALNPTQPSGASLQVGYEDAPLEALLGESSVLAVLGFGRAAPAAHADPRYFNCGLEPLSGAPFEVWRVEGRVQHGRQDAISWARSERLSFGAMALFEADHGGLATCAQVAYQGLLEHLASGPHPALLRSWNYLDAITEGEGDLERYRQFCLGRARGMGGRIERYPAATAIGLRDGQRCLRLYWLSASEPGVPVENPRQVAAWRYPRQYGPQPPSFSRATLPRDPRLPLLLSGTASVVGHASLHGDSLAMQIDETFRNFSSLLHAARGMRPELATQFGPSSLLKVYLRDHAEQDTVARLLDAHLPQGTPLLVLAADICRAELRIEIDGFHR